MCWRKPQCKSITSTHTTTILMPPMPSSLNLSEQLHIPDSDGTEGSEMESNSASYSKPETVAPTYDMTVVPTSDIYEREVYSLL